MSSIHGASAVDQMMIRIGMRVRDLPQVSSRTGLMRFCYSIQPIRCLSGGHFGCKFHLASRMELTLLPTCLPGQGGCPEGDAAGPGKKNGFERIDRLFQS
jgi:hypothetical protein